MSKKCEYNITKLEYGKCTVDETYVCNISSGRSRIYLGIPLPTRKLLSSSVKKLQLCLKRLYVPGLKKKKDKCRITLVSTSNEIGFFSDNKTE